ncbi:MAG: type II toxin-antitoxin system VapC family toxin [Nitrospirae bacterium]|nr:type II toxin-antitoxin system VapC family toxin [Nitrospirota bacterium]
MIFQQNKVFCDTSFFFASLCPDDFNFEKAGELLEYCKENKTVLYTTWDIIGETITLIRYRADYNTAVEFFDKVKPALSIVRFDDSVRIAAETVFRKLSKDKRLSFCDAISYVVITHMLDNIPCLSFDKDFRSLGLMVYP